MNQFHSNKWNSFKRLMCGVHTSQQTWRRFFFSQKMFLVAIVFVHFAFHTMNFMKLHRFHFVCIIRTIVVGAGGEIVVSAKTHTHILIKWWKPLISFRRDSKLPSMIHSLTQRRNCVCSLHIVFRSTAHTLYPFIPWASLNSIDLFFQRSSIESFVYRHFRRKSPLRSEKYKIIFI